MERIVEETDLQVHIYQVPTLSDEEKKRIIAERYLAYKERRSTRSRLKYQVMKRLTEHLCKKCKQVLPEYRTTADAECQTD